MSPRQRVSVYSPDEWEEFVLELAAELKPRYERVQRMAGSGDGGLDVIGLATRDGLEAEWDCYQCKHYAGTLKPGEALLELVKLFNTVLSNGYTFPRLYEFVSPKGPGVELAKMVNTPSKLKTFFLEKAGKIAREKLGCTEAQVEAIISAAKDQDFTNYKTLDLIQALAIHQTSPYHSARFGLPLPPRAAHEPPPQFPAHHESQYISELLRAYGESIGVEDLSLEKFLAQNKHLEHYRRQREYFYSAEALRLFARDCVPPGTFEEFTNEFFHGVVEVHEREYPSGLARLTEVLSAVHNIQITSNDLIHRCQTQDRNGICHQLANEGRLSWTRSSAP